MSEQNNSSENNQATVFQESAETYGDAYQSHLFDQYKLFVDSALRVTEWRKSANSYFLTLNTAIISLFGLATTFHDTMLWQWYIACAGVLLAIVWFVMIKIYKQLNTAKFEVIHELESRLPAAIFDREWQILKKKCCHGALTTIETIVPIVFAVIYVVMSIFSYCQVS